MTIAISSLQSSRMTLGTCSDELVKRRFDRPYPITGVTMADISLLMNGGLAELKEQAHGLQKPSLDPFAFRGRARTFNPMVGSIKYLKLTGQSVSSSLTMASMVSGAPLCDPG